MNPPFSLRKRPRKGWNSNLGVNYWVEQHLCELKLCCLEKWGGKVWKYVERWEKLQATRKEGDREDYFTAWDKGRTEYITCNSQECCGGWNGGTVGIGYWGKWPMQFGQRLTPCCGLAMHVHASFFPRKGTESEQFDCRSKLVVTLSPPPPACWTPFNDPPPPNSWTPVNEECHYLDDGCPSCSSAARKARQNLPEACSWHLDADLRVNWIQKKIHLQSKEHISLYQPGIGWKYGGKAYL